MNKLFKKIATLSVGLAMAIGVGIAIGSNYHGMLPVHAANGSVTLNTTFFSLSGNSYTTKSVTDSTSGVTFNISDCNVNNGLNMKKSSGAIWNSTGFSNKKITSIGLYDITFSTSSSAGFYVYGGTSAKSTTTTLLDNSGSTADTTVDFSGYSYNYFYIKNKGTRTTAFSKIVISYTDVTTNVTVSFNANGHGTAPASQTFVSGGKATDPGAPTGTTTGYEFDGWYENSSCTGSAWNFNTTISANKTLWAKWTATTYSVGYNLDGGTHGSTHPTSGTYDTAFSVSAPTKTGYTFTGWTVTAGLDSSTAKWGTTSSPSTAISSSSTLCVNGTNAVYFKNINATSTAVTLTANWSITSYTVGGTISNGHLSSTANVNYNNALDIEIVPDTDYTYPSSIEVTMGGAAYAGYTYDSTHGLFHIEHVTGNVVINAECVSTSATERFFDYNLSHCSISNAPTSMYDTETKVLQIVADDHYKFPSSITVTGISDDKWDYDAVEGTILINEPDGNIDLTVACVKKAQNTITMDTLTGVSAAEGNPTAVEEGATVTLTFTANSGYGLPTSTGVTVAGSGSSFIWTQGTGKLQITGGTGNITVSIIGIQRDLTDGNLTLGTKKDSYTTGDDFELPSSVTANFNLAPLTVNVKNDVEVSGPVVKNSNKYIVTDSGTITLTYTYEPTGSTQSASYTITTTPVTPTSAKYVKVTSSSSVTAGDYLVVYGEGNVAFNGGLSTLDAVSNTISVEINNNEIASNATTNAAKFTFASVDGGFSIKSASDYYIGRTANSNGLNASASEAYVNIIEIDDDENADIISSVGPKLRFNSNSGQNRFRYFTSAQQVIQLYKYQGATVKELKWITATVKSGTYYKGTSVTASNFDVIGHYNNGDTLSITSGITVTDGYLANVGANKVTLTYSGLSCEVTVNATQAPVSTLSIDPTSASIGLNENYNLSNVTVTVTPSYAIDTYTWALIDAGGLAEGTDYTFENDVYHSKNPGTVVFRCTSTADASKFGDFTLFISGNPEINIAESSVSGYAGKGDVLHFTYMNIADDKLDKITFSSSAPSVVDLANGPDAGSGSGTVELEYKSAGTATVSVSYDGGSTLDTVSVTVSNDRVVSVTWSATDIDVWSGATLSTTGWNVQYEMASGDTGAADSYTIKLGSETVTAGYVFKGTDNGKTLHVEYGNVSSTSINVTVTQRINDVWAKTYIENDWSHEIEAKTWSEAGSQTLNGKSWTQGGTGNGYWGYEAARGQQFGSGSNPYNPLTLESSAFAGTISKVEVTTAGGSSVAGTVSVSVGGTSFKCGNETSVSITGTSTKYTFTGTGSGTITITWSQTSSKALYLKALSVTTLTEGQSVQIANSESHKEAQRKVVEFANYMNTMMNGENVCTGSFANLQTAWNSVATKYNQLFGTGTTLSKTELAWAKDLLKYATAEWGSEEENACLEKAMKTYEFCVSHYSDICSRFMYEADGTTPLRSVTPVHSFNLLSNNISAVATVVIISIVSAAAIGGYFFLRKKKED